MTSAAMLPTLKRSILVLFLFLLTGCGASQTATVTAGDEAALQAHMKQVEDAERLHFQEAASTAPQQEAIGE